MAGCENRAVIMFNNLASKARIAHLYSNFTFLEIRNSCVDEPCSKS
jgi:hypothetical protein